MPGFLPLARTLHRQLPSVSRSAGQKRRGNVVAIGRFFPHDQNHVHDFGDPVLLARHQGIVHV